MIINKALMSRARFEKKQIGELTVKEFRTLMQECLDSDRAVLKGRKNAEAERLHKLRYE